MSSTANLTAESTTDLQQNGNHPSETKPKFKDLKCADKLRYIKNVISVEPLLICYMMPSLIANLAIQNLTLQMACRVNLGFNETICSDLLSLNNTEYEKQVEVAVARMIQWKTPLNTAIPALLILFLGSYSDRHKKRKPFLLMPLAGEFAATIAFIFCAINISRWPMEVVGVSESLFPAISGGLTTMMMAVYSYVADVSTVEMRTLRIGIVHIVSAVAAPVGFSMSGILYETIGFFGIFAISIVLYIIAVSYGIFVLKEPKQATDDIKRNVCIDLFDPKHVINTFTVIFKKRSGSQRIRIVLLMCVFIVIIGPSYGEATLAFYYTRAKFQWGAVEYSLYATYDIIIHLVGTLLALLIFCQWLKLDDLLLAAIACASKVAASFMYSFSKTPTLFYFAPLVSIFTGAGAIAMRSIATKLVVQDEIGKIQSLFGICEAIAPIIYNTIYSKVYIATINVMPGAFFLLGAALIAPAVFIFIVMYILQQRDVKKNKQEDIENNKMDVFKYSSEEKEHHM